MRPDREHNRAAAAAMALCGVFALFLSVVNFQGCRHEPWQSYAGTALIFFVSGCIQAWKGAAP